MKFLLESVNPYNRKELLHNEISVKFQVVPITSLALNFNLPRQSGGENQPKDKAVISLDSKQEFLNAQIAYITDVGLMQVKFSDSIQLFNFSNVDIYSI